MRLYDVPIVAMPDTNCMETTAGATAFHQEWLAAVKQRVFLRSIFVDLRSALNA